MSKEQEVAKKLFIEIADKWHLDDQEKTRLLNQNLDEPFSQNALFRVSHLIRIQKILHSIFEDPDRANAWIKKPNRAFEGRSGLAVAIKDPEIVRNYLEIQMS